MGSQITKNKKLERKFERLILNPNFQSEIVRLRKKWKIPKNGFRRQNATLKWHAWLDEQTDVFFEGDVFRKMHLRSKKLYNEIQKKNSKHKKDGLKELDLLRMEINAATPINAFYNDIIELRKLGNLSNAFSDTMHWYLLTNKVHSIQGPSVGVRSNGQNKHKDELFINIYPETTLKDIEKIWWMVKLHQRGRLGSNAKRLKNYPKLERDKRIAELHQQNMPHEEIAKIINNEFGENIMYFDVAKILNKLKRSTS